MPTVFELCRIAYPKLNPKEIEKKHRLSVLRAAANVAKRMGWQPIKITAITSTVIYCEGKHFTELCDSGKGREHLRDLVRGILAMQPPFIQLKAVTLEEDTARLSPYESTP